MTKRSIERRGFCGALFAPLALRAQTPRTDTDKTLEELRQKRARGERITPEEQQQYRSLRQQQMKSSTSVTMPVISEGACPLTVISVAAKDGHETPAVMRMPPGGGPFPAIIYLHGGLATASLESLKKMAVEPTESRFLAAGWVTVIPTFRERAQNPQTRNALLDCLGVVEHVRHMPQVDARSVIVWGTSGGASLALEVAGESDVTAILADEPASVLFTGIMKNREELQQQMETPQKYYTPELKKFTEEKIARIRCPIFLVEGGVHPINRINNEIVIPALVAAGKNLKVKMYPGEAHGCSRGNGTPETAKEFFEDATRFVSQYIATKPVPLPASLVRYVPATRNVPMDRV